MADCQITCIEKSASNGGYSHITYVGNPTVPWRLSVDRVIRDIDAKTNTFYVKDPKTGKRANVGVVREAGKAAYIRTYADGVWNDNLLSLTTCPYIAA